jgi:hypothetical protein
VGAEICYSGSFSGVVCGNIVQQTNVSYGVGGDLNALTGTITLQSGGQPAVGNGDSGGPGYMLVSQNGTLKRYASLIISAIPSGSGTTCTGVPGDATRKCSAQVWATSAPLIAATLGWAISTE